MLPPDEDVQRSMTEFMPQVCLLLFWGLVSNIINPIKALHIPLQEKYQANPLARTIPPDML